MVGSTDFDKYLKLVPDTPQEIPISSFKKFPAWRPHQREAIAKTLMYIDEGYENIVVTAPTGFGKSLYAMTLAWLLLGFKEVPGDDGLEYIDGAGVLTVASGNKAYVVTATKQLQDQYLEDFSFIKTIKGRSNYPCLFMPGLTANECMEKAGTKCPVRDNCPYLLARKEAVDAPVTIHNYAYFLNALNYTRVWPEGTITIFDEGHLAEKSLADFVELRIAQHTLESMGIDIKLPPEDYLKDIANALYFIEDLDYKVSFEIDVIKDRLMTTNSSNTRKVRELTSKLERLERLKRKTSFLSSQLDESWIIKSRDGIVSFRPVWVKDWGGMLLKHSQINLFMSATINWKNVELLGIDREDIATVDVPAIFPASRRPIIIYRPVFMSYKRMEKAKWEALSVVDELLGIHFGLGHKGLVHTANTAIADFIKKNSRYNKQLIVAYGKDRQVALQKFLQSEKPVALISPSLEVGTDLKYDQGRFQIIVKTPFPNLSDDVVKHRLSQDREWFDMVTCERLVQAYGRTNRAEDDYSITYIIDSNIFRLLRNQFIPDWFKEAIVPKKQALMMIEKMNAKNKNKNAN